VSEGRAMTSSVRTRDFLLLSVENSRSRDDFKDGNLF
jgi:hypothetical protein